MIWEDLTLSDVQRLIEAIEQAGGSPEAVRAIIDRVPARSLVHGRVSMRSLLRLLGQTAGSTSLPEAIVIQLNAPELAPQPLLQFILRITLPVPPRRYFVAREHFVVGNTDGVMIGDCRLSDHFLSLIEDRPISPGQLSVYELARKADDVTIVAALGDRHAILLADLWVLLAAQSTGMPGPLLTQNRANICYIRDQQGLVRVIHLLWHDNHGWIIDGGLLGSLNDGPPYCAGHHIISY